MVQCEFDTTSGLDLLRVQNIGDGINDELRLDSGKTSLIPACPTFGVTESTLRQAVHLVLHFSEKRSDDTILWCSAS